MPEGGILRIRSEKTFVRKEELPLKEGVYTKISIEDQGTGIPAKYINNIFDPYFSTKDIGRQKGMGLGLTICYSIVKRHGGLITVESAEGKGTSFHIYLPVLDDEISKVDEKSP